MVFNKEGLSPMTSRCPSPINTPSVHGLDPINVGINGLGRIGEDVTTRSQENKAGYGLLATRPDTY